MSTVRMLVESVDVQNQVLEDSRYWCAVHLCLFSSIWKNMATCSQLDTMQTSPTRKPLLANHTPLFMRVHNSGATMPDTRI